MEVMEVEEKDRRKREKLAMEECFYEVFQGDKRGTKFVFESLGDFTYLPAEKMDEYSQTYMKTNHLSFSQIEGMKFIPKTQHINLENKVF